MNDTPHRFAGSNVRAARGPVRTAARASRSIVGRRRFQFGIAVLLGALLPLSLRGPLLPGHLLEAASVNALIANVIAVTTAVWMRLSIETYPGIRRAYVILPSALSCHGATLVWFALTRFPYD